MGGNASKKKIHSELSFIKQSNSDQIIQQEKHIQSLQQAWFTKDLQPGESPDKYELYERGRILQNELEKLYSLKNNTVKKLNVRKGFSIWTIHNGKVITIPNF
jgi:hypothetical protein